MGGNPGAWIIISMVVGMGDLIYLVDLMDMVALMNMTLNGSLV